jgi:RNA polymerase sigma-70 factor (ECF subfamily)
MDRETELVLVRRLREGDHAAFDAVFDEFHNRLFLFLARLSRQRDVAQDLLDETWMRLVTHAGGLQPDTRLGAWLFTVARNLFVSYCRSRLLDESCRVDLISLWPVAAPAPSPFEAVAARELERRVERAIATLPARYREVLLLVAIEGFSAAQAAAVCGVSQEALRQRLARARAMLAKELQAGPRPVVPSMSEAST